VPTDRGRPSLKLIPKTGGEEGGPRSNRATNAPAPPFDYSALRPGLHLFNHAHFFDAHEVLEDLWRSLPSLSLTRQRLRLHVQGMIQLAVAFHHASTGNRVGALSVLQRALRNLKGAERSFPQLDFDRLRAESALWETFLDRSVATGAKTNRRHPAPALPKIRLRRTSA
jgi:hypothetical protein